METLKVLGFILFYYLLVGFIFLLICEITISLLKKFKRTKKLAFFLFPSGITSALKLNLVLLWPLMMKIFIQAIKMKFIKDKEVKTEIIKTKSNFQERLERMADENKEKKADTTKSKFQQHLEEMAAKKS